MVFLASLHVDGGVCASGKLALAGISTRSTSGPFFLLGGRLSNRSEIGRASRQKLCRVACQISGQYDQHTRLISRLSRPPGFGGGASCRAQLTGAQNNLLEYIACNICIYMTLVIILQLDPRHHFAWTCVIILSMYSLYTRWINDFWFWFWFHLMTSLCYCLLSGCQYHTYHLNHLHCMVKRLLSSANKNVTVTLYIFVK